MTKASRWAIGSVALALVLGGVYVAGPVARANAADNVPSQTTAQGSPFTDYPTANPAEMAQQMGGQHVAMMANFKGDMSEMHQAMTAAAPAMAEAGAQMAATLGEKLGLSPGELRAELAKGRTIAELASSKGVDAAEIKALATSQAQTVHKALVAKGVLSEKTASQMDAMMSGSNLDFMLNANLAGMAGMMGGAR